jgi:Tol biopolymer transport system component
MNADGTGFRRLTTANNLQHVFGSLSPDGQSVVYAAFREANVYEIYEMKLNSSHVKQLTNRLGILNAPEISPDGQSIVFKRTNPANGENQIWIETVTTLTTFHKSMVGTRPGRRMETRSYLPPAMKDSLNYLLSIAMATS